MKMTMRWRMSSRLTAINESGEQLTLNEVGQIPEFIYVLHPRNLSMVCGEGNK